MKKAIFFLMLSVPCSFLHAQGNDWHDLVGLSSGSPLNISQLIVNSERIGLYEKFEITFNLGGHWDNPFDPHQIRVDAVFRRPDGKKVTVPGFFYQEYYLNAQNKIEKVGEPVWKVRFTPVIAGKYSFYVTASNQGREIQSSPSEFECISFNTNHGFIKVSKCNPLYFDFSDGTSFFGIGMDRIQADEGGCYQRFSSSGGNFNRLFLTNGKVDIQELTRDPGRPDRGLGKINLENSWNLDKLLELGENLGIYHMLTLTNQYNFNRQWDIHTYNRANGGLLDSKNEYFTNEEAMQYFEKYLRYLVARWGYSTAVFSWDLWNEYSAMGIEVEVAIPWHLRMTRYIDSLDIFDHIIHTNDGLFNGNDKMHSLPEIEIVSTNTYAIKDIAYLASVWTRRMITTFNKPYVLTEYGMGHNPPPGAYGAMDPDRRMVHNGLWSPFMNGSAATGMPWEANWLNDSLFFTYIQAVKKIVHDIPFSKRSWKLINVSSFKFMDPHPDYYADIIVEGWPGNFRLDRENAPEKFRIDKNGRVLNQESLTALLTGELENSGNATKEVSFQVDYPVNGQFITYVTELRDEDPAPRLTVLLDGKQVLQEDLLPLAAENYHPVMYNQYYTVDIPEGSHMITVSNQGGGRIVTSFELKNFLLKNGPDLNVQGIQTNDFILLWLKNQKFTVLHEMVGIPLEVQAEGILELAEVPDGTWLAEWVNTVDAIVIRSELVNSSKGKLILQTPITGKSVAVRLQKI
jgi:hypothetical protein